MRKLLLIMPLLIALSFISVSAHECELNADIKTTSQLLSQVDSLNTKLQDCPQEVPSQMQRLIKDGVFWLEITDTEDVYATIAAGHIIGVAKGIPEKYDYKTTMSSCVIDNILQKENAVGAFAAYYLSGKANLGASGFVNKVKLWFGKLFLKPAFKKIKVEVSDTCETSIKSNVDNKPENCYETYMQGHEQYQYAKAEWDRRLAETGHICQTQTSAPPKGGKCIYTFEQIKNNDKKWLCWY